MAKTIYQLELHEVIEIYKYDSSKYKSVTVVIRVPGGWIYKTERESLTPQGTALSESSVFVPFDKEFVPSSNKMQ